LPDRPRLRSRIAEIRKTLGLDRPLPDQFAHYVNDLAHGNFGNSLSTRPSGGNRNHQPAAGIRPSSLCWDCSSPSSSRCRSAFSPRSSKGSLIDHLCRIVATAVRFAAGFFTGLLLVYIFYFKLGWVAGADRPARCLRHHAARYHRLLSDRQAS